MEDNNKITLFESFGDIEETEWVLKRSKMVSDIDGFLTDYTWYFDPKTDRHIFILGDTDVYGPDENYADWECDSEKEAQEWFDSYNGCDDECAEDLDEAIVEAVQPAYKVLKKKFKDSLSWYKVACNDKGLRLTSTEDDAVSYYSVPDMLAHLQDLGKTVEELDEDDVEDLLDFKHEEKYVHHAFDVSEYNAFKKEMNNKYGFSKLTEGESEYTHESIKESVEDSGMSPDRVAAAKQLRQIISKAKKAVSLIDDCIKTNNLYDVYGYTEYTANEFRSALRDINTVLMDLKQKESVTESLEEKLTMTEFIDVSQNIADQLSEYLDDISQMPNQSDYFDEYDMKALGDSTDCLYDAARAAHATIYVESAEGDQIAKDAIDSSNDNFEKDKEAERQAKVELAKQGIETKSLFEATEDSIIEVTFNKEDSNKWTYEGDMNSDKEFTSLTQAVMEFKKACLKEFGESTFGDIQKDTSGGKVIGAVLQATIKKPLTEGAIKNICIEIDEEGGVEAFQAKLEKEIKELEDYLSSDAVSAKLVNAGGNFDSEEEKETAIKNATAQLNELKAKLAIVKNC